MYTLSRMRINYILRCGSPELKHELPEELKRLIAIAKIDDSVPLAEGATVNEADGEAKKNGKKGRHD